MGKPCRERTANVAFYRAATATNTSIKIHYSTVVAAATTTTKVTTGSKIKVLALDTTILPQTKKSLVSTRPMVNLVSDAESNTDIVISTKIRIHHLSKDMGNDVQEIAPKLAATESTTAAQKPLVSVRMDSSVNDASTRDVFAFNISTNSQDIIGNNYECTRANFPYQNDGFL